MDSLDLYASNSCPVFKCTKIWRCIWSTDAFAPSSLRGKLGGLYACGATFPYIVALPNFVLTLLFSKTRLKRKDFQEILRLPWAQEVPSSNLGAPDHLLLSYQ